MIKKTFTLVIFTFIFLSFVMMAKAVFSPQAKLTNVAMALGEFLVPGIAVDVASPVIEILDQKVSEDLPKYFYLKVRVLDNVGLQSLSVLSELEELNVTYFMSGYFYNVVADFPEDYFWLIIPLLNDQQAAIKIVATDLAGNNGEKEVVW